MPYIIAVDIGTTNTKVIGYSTSGEIISTAGAGYPAMSSPPGIHEQDPEILFEAVMSCLEKVIQESYRGQTLLGVCFSSAMHGLMAVDKRGNPLTALITWADLRSKNYARDLKYSKAGKRISHITGTPVHPMSPLCKIIWMKEELPLVFNSTSKFISFKEYAFWKFFGQYVVDHSIASSTGLFDIYKKYWDEEALNLSGITTGQLSVPVNTSFILTGLKKEYARRLIIDENTPFIIGASDGCLANLGSNAIHSGDVSVTIGTSSAVRMVISDPGTGNSPDLFNYILSEDLYVRGGASNNGGILLKWYAENFLNRKFTSPDDFIWFVDEATSAPPGCDGLVFLPYVFGERAPVWDADAKGVFFGVHSGHTQAHFMRAIIEGISFALFEMAKLLEEDGSEIKNIYASGGFIRSKKWLQLIADVFGKKIEVANATDASAVGAAILGLRSLGIIADLSEGSLFIDVSESYFPDEQNHRLYLENYSIYACLYNSLRSEFAKMTNLRKEVDENFLQ